MNTQKGSAHLFIIVGILALIFGALSVVFVKSFVEPEPSPTKNTNKPEAEMVTGSQKPIAFKSFTSPTGSGLSFSYPDNWLFDSNVEQRVLGNGTKVLLLMLTSEDPNSSKAKEDGYMCVQLTERTGGPMTTQMTFDKKENSEYFEIGQNTIALTKSNFGYQLYNSESDSAHGAYYVPLNNEHYLVAISQYNCASPDKKQLNSSPIEDQAKGILKSIKLE